MRHLLITWHPSGHDHLLGVPPLNKMAEQIARDSAGVPGVRRVNSLHEGQNKGGLPSAAGI